MAELWRAIPLLADAGTRRRLWVALAGSVVVALAEVAGLLFIVPLMELLTDTGDMGTGLLGRLSSLFGDPDRDQLALIVAGLVLVAFLAKALFTIIFRWWMLGFVYEQEAATATDLLRSYLAAPYWLHLERNSAELIRNMHEATTQTYSLLIGAISVIAEIAVIVGIGGALLLLEPIPALAALAYFGVIGAIFQRVVRTRTQTAGSELTETAFRTYRTAHHALHGVKEITVRNGGEHFVEEYRAQRARLATAKRLSVYLGELPRYLLEVLFIIGVAVFVAVVFSGRESDEALAVLALFVAAGFRLLPSLMRLMGSVTLMRVGQKGFALVTADLRSFATSPEASEVDAAPPVTIQHELTFDAVSFTYPGNEAEVLRSISLTIGAGEAIGLVGGSGAGKSTLVDLILGLHQPTAGTIRADGSSITGNLPAWREQIGLVPQEVYLLDDSLSANVAFGVAAGAIDRDRVVEVCHLAQLDGLVDSLPSGLDTFVGERGVRLSGGQRQRIGIARALYAGPRLLILDEATSALDNETERRITDTIEALHGQLTMVVVAHRLSTVRHCDRLVHLEDGEIQAVGSFDELVAADKGFASLVQLANVGPGRTSTPEPETVSMKPTGVSVVIPHYGDPSAALHLVSQLQDEHHPDLDLQLIVVDDRSPQPFPDHPGVEVVRRPGNGGFGAAVNSGAARAHHDLLLILNSDLELSTRDIAELVRRSAPFQPAVSSPRLVDAGGHSGFNARRWPRTSMRLVEWLVPLARFRDTAWRHRLVGHDLRSLDASTAPVDWLVGAVLLLPRTAFEAAGGFDEGYRMNSEEVDLQRQLRAVGIPSVLVGEVVAVHTGGGSSDDAARLRWVTQARLRYERKWNGPAAAQTLRLGLWAVAVVNLAWGTGKELAGRPADPRLLWSAQSSALSTSSPRRHR